MLGKQACWHQHVYSAGRMLTRDRILSAVAAASWVAGDSLATSARLSRAASASRRSGAVARRWGDVLGSSFSLHGSAGWA